MKNAIITFLCGLFCCTCVFAQSVLFAPGSVFREYSYLNRLTPMKGDFAYYESFQAVLYIDDIKDAENAEVAINFWGGHIGTSDQAFSINGSVKYNFPQPKTPGNPFCYYRFVHGNPAVKVPASLLKKGKNVFTFYCGKQVCYGFNWPHYWLNSFTVRVFYNPRAKKYARGIIKKVRGNAEARNLVSFQTAVDDSTQVESVDYVGYYEEFDLDGDGEKRGWQYRIEDGEWRGTIGRKKQSPYLQSWDNFWVPEQKGPIKIVSKINSSNGLSYLTEPVTFDELKQHNFSVKMFETKELGENFSSRVGRKKECTIPIDTDLSDAISAYVVFSSWSGAPDDGLFHSMGINGRMLAESPGKVHDWAYCMIPVPLEYLKKGDNIFYIYSETDEHMFEINYPGPAVLVRFRNSGDPAEKGKKDNAFKVQLNVDKNFATIENSAFRMKYANRVFKDGAVNNLITELTIKGDPENQAAEDGQLDGVWMGYGKGRGSLTASSNIKFESNDRKILHLEWGDGQVIQEITAFPDKPYIKIDYIKYGINIVDIGYPGGDSGVYKIYNSEKWQEQRSAITTPALINHPNEHHRLTTALYPRYPFPLIDTPDWDSLGPSPLIYKGYLIMGLYNPKNGRGYGRVMPANAINYLKLLWGRGFEGFPFWRKAGVKHATNPVRPAFTGYFFVVTKGAEEVVSLGKSIVDEAAGIN